MTTEFGTWKQDVWEPFIETRKGQWENNSAEHREIIKRLDSLNGWRNKLLGVLVFISVTLPIITALIASGHIKISL